MSDTVTVDPTAAAANVKKQLTISKKTVFRIQGIPTGTTDEDLKEALLKEWPKEKLERLGGSVEIMVTMCQSCYSRSDQTALVQFSHVPDYLSSGKYQLRVDGSVVDIDNDFYGFTPLYSTTPNVEIKADIIAVTGLAGHAFGSWRGRGSLRTMWLRDFLADDLPDCRTVTYGYNSRLDDKNGTHTTVDYTRGFLEEIKKIRTGKEINRPVVFICHSFGGIVVAQSLLRSLDEHNPALKSLFPATYATIFFATPHRGMIMDDMLSAIGEKSPRAALLKSIQTDADALVQGYYRFINKASEQKLQIVSFYEQQQRSILKKNSKTQMLERNGEEKIVLDSQSSLLNLPDTIERKIPVDKDHSEITKFDSRNDSTYTTLLGYLEKFRSEEHNLHNCITAYCAIEHKNMRALKAMCAKGRADVTAVQKDRRTLLHHAAGSGNEEAIELLLDKNANIEAVDIDQNTPLLLAAKGGHEEAVICLLNNQANIEAKNKRGETALFLAAQESHEEVAKTLLEKKANSDTTLLLAATQKNEAVVDFLLQHNADSSNALFLAAKDENEEVMEFLLDRGADGGTALLLAQGDTSAMDLLLGYDIDKNKALYLAVKGKHEAIVDLLLQNGANKDQALILAAKAGRLAPVIYLLNKGADVNAENKSGETALFLAVQGYYRAVSNKLIGEGANKHIAMVMAAKAGDQKAISFLREIV